MSTATPIGLQKQNGNGAAAAAEKESVHSPVSTASLPPLPNTETVLSVLTKLGADLPEYTTGVERQRIIDKRIGAVDEKVLILLRRWFQSVLARMRDLDGSDIDMGSNGAQGRIWLRIHGFKRPEPSLPSLNVDMSDVLLQSLVEPNQRKHLFENRSIDFSFSAPWDGKMQRYRATIYFDLDFLGLNMRAITAKIRSFSSYGFHPEVAGIMNLSHTKEGLILITGITGSGKSTTLDAIIDANNATVDSHIIIIGAPIEYVHTPIRSVIRHREVGRDVLSFKDGTVQALRQDPDIVVIGEMRDPETIMAALEITDSGHKVFSTLHTSAAVESIDRVIGECPPYEQERVRNRLADVLKCVVSQKLVPTIDGKRIMAKEVLVVTPSVRAAIKNGNTSEIYQMINEGFQVGMHTIEQDLKRLVNQRKISAEEAMNYSNNKRRMHQLLTAK